MTVAVHAARAGEEDKMAMGLAQLVREDPSLHVEHDAHLGQITLSGQGEQHLDIARFRLKTPLGRGRGLRARRASATARPSRAAPSRQYRHKKQTGGAGQFADLTLHVEPLTETYEPHGDLKMRREHTLETAWGSRVHFVDAIVGGVIDMQRFFGAIQKGVAEALQHGPVAGYPVGDVRVVVADGGDAPRRLQRQRLPHGGQDGLPAGLPARRSRPCSSPSRSST